MKVEYIQCDLCGGKILENDPYYELCTKPKRKSCGYDGHTLEICQTCAYQLSISNIKISNYKNDGVVCLSNKLFTIKE